MESVITFDRVLAHVGHDHESWRQPVTFRIESSQCVAIRTLPGHSAAMLALCIGLTAPERGTVTVLGTTPSALSRRQLGRWRTEVGTVLQPEGLVATLSLRANVIIPLVYTGRLSHGDARVRATEVLDALELMRWADRRPSEVPADVRQRAALARALAPLPSVLLLEDPLASLASRDAARLFQLCREWVPTVVVTTHRRNPALYEVADRVVLWDAAGFRAGDA